MGKKAQTIGYWYKLAAHYGLCLGPIDALLEVRGGDRTAWAGRQAASGTIAIDEPNLWGGEKSEGGIVGDLDVMMGEATQAPNAYLASTFGPEQSGYRGKATVVFKGGKWGALNPYPKAPAFKVERILAGWDNDTVWYPEKAKITMVPPEVFIEDLAFSATSAGVGPYAGIVIDSGFLPSDTLIVDKPVGLTYQAWSAWASDAEALDGLPWTNQFKVTANGVDTLYWGGFYATPEAAELSRVGEYIYLRGASSYTLWLDDEPPEDNRGGLSLRVYKNGVTGMNPAHILYDSITSTQGGQGEPVGLINEASFTAAADKLHAEGFGLCMAMSDGDIEAFQQRVCDIIGGNLTQSRVDGQYYLDLIRADYVLEDLLIVTEDDVVEFSEDQAEPTELVNQVIVEWFDPVTKQDRATAPVQALGAIQAAGGVISETRTYREVPTEALGLRLAKRDLKARGTPLKRFNLTTNRRLHQLRPGVPFRLQMASEGIADMVCWCGSADFGTLTDGRMRITAVQDVFSMPDAVYVDPEPGKWVPPSTIPVAPPAQTAFEAPYVELAGTLSAADLAALTDTAGYLATAATRPDVGINYTLWTWADGETGADHGTADWCPSAVIVEAAALVDPLPTAFTLSDAADLDQVGTGTAALWGEEIVRVDAIDSTALTITLGRACADTVPAVHAAGERIWFYDATAGSDAREYADGETVHAKLLTRTGSAELAPESAIDSVVVMDGRQARPYPPGQFRLNDSSYPAALAGNVTVSWAHRDRVVQADQLIDTGDASTGPETGTTYTVRYYLGGVLTATESGIAGTAATPYAFPGDGVATIELEAVRDGLVSLQFHAWSFNYTSDEPVDEETTTWETTILGLGGSITEGERAIADDLIKAIKATTYGSKIVYLLPFIGGSIAAHRVPLRDSLVVGAAANGGASPFTDADCNTATGIDNSTEKAAYLDTGITPSQLGTSVNGGLGWYERAFGAGTGVEAIGAYDDTGSPDMRFVLDLRSTFYAFNWGAPANGAGVVATTASAHYYGQRSSATLRRVYTDGVSMASKTVSEVPTGTSDRTIYVMGNNRSPATYWKGRCACAYLTDGTLSDADVADFHTLLNTYLITPTGR